MLLVDVCLYDEMHQTVLKHVEGGLALLLMIKLCKMTRIKVDYFDGWLIWWLLFLISPICLSCWFFSVISRFGIGSHLPPTSDEHPRLAAAPEDIQRGVLSEDSGWMEPDLWGHWCLCDSGFDSGRGRAAPTQPTAWLLRTERSGRGQSWSRPRPVSHPGQSGPLPGPSARWTHPRYPGRVRFHPDSRGRADQRWRGGEWRSQSSFIRGSGGAAEEPVTHKWCLPSHYSNCQWWDRDNQGSDLGRWVIPGESRQRFWSVDETRRPLLGECSQFYWVSKINYKCYLINPKK